MSERGERRCRSASTKERPSRDRARAGSTRRTEGKWERREGSRTPAQPRTLADAVPTCWPRGAVQLAGCRERQVAAKGGGGKALVNSLPLLVPSRRNRLTSSSLALALSNALKSSVSPAPSCSYACITAARLGVNQVPALSLPCMAVVADLEAGDKGVDSALEAGNEVESLEGWGGSWDVARFCWVRGIIARGVVREGQGGGNVDGERERANPGGGEGRATRVPPLPSLLSRYK